MTRDYGIFPRAHVAAALLILAVWDSGSADQQEKKWTIRAAAETEIGEATGEQEYMFQAIASARLLPDGRIIVADAGLRDLRIFGKDGKLQRRIGRPGQGPGEFSQIGGLWLTSKGLIAVWDAGNRRITTFNALGNLESTHRVDGIPAAGNLEVFFGSFGNDEIVLASLAFGRVRNQVAPDQWTLGRFGLTGDFRGSLGEIRGMWRFNRSPVPFSPMPVVVPHGDLIFVADGYEGEIAVRNSRGLVIRTIGLPSVKAVSSEAVWSTLEAAVRQRKMIVYIEYLEQKKVPRQNQFPQISALLSDDRGYIWAKVYDPYTDSIWLRMRADWQAPGGEWRVIRPNGGIVTTVRMPDAVRPLEIKGDRLLGVAFDEFGVQRIVVHPIQR